MNQKNISNRIYPSVVTFEGDPHQMIKDVSRLKLTEISLFLTTASYRQRKEIYKALESSTVKKIPHVHIRHDQKEEELDYLVKRFKSKAFTLHYQYIKHFKNSKHLKKIFIENNWGASKIESYQPITKVGGVCIDLSHVVDNKNFFPSADAKLQGAVQRFRVGCNHISGIRADGKSYHTAQKFSDFDYLKDLPKKYFSRYLNIEVGNSIPEQIKFKQYIAKILMEAWKK